MFNMSPSVMTPMSQDMYDLHKVIFWICVVTALLVFCFLICTLVMHRKSHDHQGLQFHSSLTVELFWTAIPFFIVVILAIPATVVLFKMENITPSDIHIPSRIIH